MNFNEKLNPSTTVKVIQSLVPKVGIASEALNKMYIYVQECSDEIGWLGTVRELDSGQHFIIEDVYLFKQDVHGTTTEITPEGLGEFAEELLARPDGVEVWNSIKMWGHSHVNMPVLPSGQDDKQMNDFKDIGHDYFIRLICNKKGEMKLDFFDYTKGITYIDIPWQIMESDEEYALQEQIDALEAQLNALKKQAVDAYKEPIKAEMKEKVRKISYATTTWQKANQTTRDPRVPHDAAWSNKYGYRDKQGNWIRFEEEEKKTTRGVTTSTSNSHGGNTTDITDTSKKKHEDNDENREESGSATIGRYTNIDYFKSDDEILEHFSDEELSLLAYMPTLKEVEYELEEYGWINMFTENDIERVYRVALKRSSGYLYGYKY